VLWPVLISLSPSLSLPLISCFFCYFLAFGIFFVALFLSSFFPFLFKFVVTYVAVNVFLGSISVISASMAVYLKRQQNELTRKLAELQGKPTEQQTMAGDVNKVAGIFNLCFEFH
jgi:hypothetical protein